MGNYYVIIALSVTLISGGCGFTPLRVNPTLKGSQNYQISVQGVDEILPKSVHMMRIHMETYLNTSKIPNGTIIKIRLTQKSGEIVYGVNATATRLQNHIMARITITLPNGHTATRDVDSITSYNQTLSDGYSNMQIQKSTEENLIHQLSHECGRAILSMIYMDGQYPLK